MSEPERKPRQKRLSPSHPRIAAEGMGDLEPTTLIDLAREKLREAAREISAPPPPHLPKGV